MNVENITVRQLLMHAGGLKIAVVALTNSLGNSARSLATESVHAVNKAMDASRRPAVDPRDTDLPVSSDQSGPFPVAYCHRVIGGRSVT